MRLLEELRHLKLSVYLSKSENCFLITHIDPEKMYAQKGLKITNLHEKLINDALLLGTIL